MIDSLINNTTCIEDEICNYCIEALKIMSDELGISYGQLNVYLFMVYIPIMMAMFMFLSVYKKRLKYLSYSLIIINLLFFIYFILNVPLI